MSFVVRSVKKISRWNVLAKRLRITAIKEYPVAFRTSSKKKANSGMRQGSIRLKTKIHNTFQTK